MTDNRTTFDEFTAVHGFSLQSKKPVLTKKVVDQYGWADNVKCKIDQTSQVFLLDQFKHYPRAEIAINRNSNGTRPSSSQTMKYCPSLTGDHTTEINNVIALGYKCSEPPRSYAHECQGDKHGKSQPVSLRPADTIQTLDRMHALMIINPLSCHWAQGSSEETMTSMGRQQEVISVPGVMERIKTPVEGVSNDSISIYHRTVVPIWSKGEFKATKRAYCAKSSPQPRAGAIMDPADYPRVQILRANMAMPICNCRFSPIAPQVENYVPGTSSTANRAGTSHQVEEADFAKTIEEPNRIKNIHSRITHRTVDLVIQDPPYISDSEEDEVPKVKVATKRSRAPKTSTAHKIFITTQGCRGDPDTTLEYVDPSPARRQMREAKLQSSNIEPSASSAFPSKMPYTSSICTFSDHSAVGGDGSDYDQPPDLVNSSYDGVDPEDPGSM